MPNIIALCCAIVGLVHTQSGTPLSGVRVELHGVTSAVTSSDPHGRFDFSAQPGQYVLSASVRSYQPLSIALALTHDVSLDIALEPLDSPKLRQLGTVTVDGRLVPIQGTIPSISLTRSDFDRLGDDRVIDGLEAVPSVTFSRPTGGAESAVSVVSLRGPDPSEALDTLDGQLLNDGNTGDLDLSRFPVAAFSSVDLTEGLGPEDAEGSNTFGGAIDFVSLRPTQAQHYALSLSAGSFGSTEAWFNTTGTQDRLGYAVALDDQNESGYVNQTVQLYQATPLGTTPAPPSPLALGSSIASHLGLVNLDWTFSQNADLNARVFTLGDNRDLSSAQNGIDGNPQDSTFGLFIGPGAETFAQVIRAYMLDGRLPLGAGELTTSLSESDNSVSVNGQNYSTPYSVNHDDHRYNLSAAWQRVFANSQFAIGGYTRYEDLNFISPPGPGPFQPTIGQTINVYYARGGFAPTAKLRLDGGVFESRYTSFGSNLDGRAGAVYTLDPHTSVRLSVGTGFRAPLLLERYQFPATQLTQDANGVFVGQGNPGEHPEHATLYELGASHEFSVASTLDVSLYRTNLRDPIEIFYPLDATAPPPGPDCTNPANTPEHPFPQCFSYNSNVGNAVYEGTEVRFVSRFAPQHLFLTALYGINVAYPEDLNAAFSNPTSGGSLVDQAQFLGIPQQQGSLQLDWAENGWHASAASIFRGRNNELNLGPFTVINALIGRQITPQADVSLAGSNLFNGAAGPFTIFGGGVPYRGVIAQGADGNPIYGPLPTDALHIEPAAVRLILTYKM
ncbi:MAG TPA: TonB-dependent receptor [Candidatus Acidoferrales bacterium]|nr:TonB-dependent receptor [Candidatus Acidoferrales bacterium]